MGIITLRFVTGNDPTSDLIRVQGGTSMPFIPSHVECVSQDGKSWIGQHMQGGMESRPVGYDADSLITLLDGTMSQLFVRLPCTDEQETAFYGYVHDKIGMLYDWVSILGFVLTEVHLHTVGSLICSAIMSAALRTKGCEWFPMPLTKPFHKISPDALLLMLSSHVQIDHTGTPKGQNSWTN